MDDASGANRAPLRNLPEKIVRMSGEKIVTHYIKPRECGGNRHRSPGCFLERIQIVNAFAGRHGILERRRRVATEKQPPRAGERLIRK